MPACYATYKPHLPMLQAEDICEWPDGTWCYASELHEMSHMSDDYTRHAVDSARWLDLVEEMDQHFNGE